MLHGPGPRGVHVIWPVASEQLFCSLKQTYFCLMVTCFLGRADNEFYELFSTIFSALIDVSFLSFLDLRVFYDTDGCFLSEVPLLEAGFR